MLTIVIGSLVLIIGGIIGGRFAGVGGMSIAGAIGIIILTIGFFGFGC
ncbi:MAG: hypothetical protein ACXABY_05950 [Candidatus Thorarchaeota archaeon]|jgi:hypothetical protein